MDEKPKRVKSGGRTKGTPNAVTAKFKDAVQIVYDEIGGHEAFAEWARANRSDFYRICSKLIPAEAAARDQSAAFGANGVTVVISQVERPLWADRVNGDVDMLNR